MRQINATTFRLAFLVDFRLVLGCSCNSKRKFKVRAPSHRHLIDSHESLALQGRCGDVWGKEKCKQEMAVIDAQIEKVFDLVVAIQIKLTMNNWIWNCNSKAIKLCAMCGYLIVSWTPLTIHIGYMKKKWVETNLQQSTDGWHLWALRACVMVKASPFRGWRIKGVASVDTPGCHRWRLVGIPVSHWWKS